MHNSSSLEMLVKVNHFIAGIILYLCVSKFQPIEKNLRNCYHKYLGTCSIYPSFILIITVVKQALHFKKLTMRHLEGI